MAVPHRPEGAFTLLAPIPDGAHVVFVQQGIAYCDRMQVAFGNPMTPLRAKLDEFRDLVDRKNIDVARLQAFCEEIGDGRKYSYTAFDELFSWASELLEELAGVRLQRFYPR